LAKTIANVNQKDDLNPNRNTLLEFFSRKFKFDDYSKKAKNGFMKEDNFFDRKEESDLNLDLNSDTLNQKEEKIIPKFNLSAKTLNILKDLEFRKTNKIESKTSNQNNKGIFDNLLLNINTYFRLA
jgi:hypothetical protein